MALDGRPSIHGPNMVGANGVLSRELVTLLLGMWTELQSVRTATTAAAATAASNTTTINEITEAADISIIGTDGVTVYGNADSGFTIQGSGSAVVPYFIDEDDSFSVAEFNQALFHMPIEVDGVLTVDGYLVEV